ncbi:MAG: MBL fold metallo-hydrolase [Oscillospiraceae bacterium]
MIITPFFGRGYFEENSFLLTDEETGKSAIIDPCFQGNLPDFSQLSLEFILLTHAHIDHMAQAAEIQERTGAKIFLHREEAALAENPETNLSRLFTEPISVHANRLLVDNEKIHLGTLEIQVLHTPGHTGGSCCYLVGNHLFTGDTLMAGSMGRTDFPTGSASDMCSSLKKLQALPNDYILHCGHGADTTLHREKNENPFLNQ